MIALPAFAFMGSWGNADDIRIRLMSAVFNIGETEQIEAGLELNLSKGWHTYWRVSGDSGLPPRLDWSGSKNVKNVEILWPAPYRKNEQGFITFAYKDQVILPLVIILEEARKAVSLDLSANIMICKDICIPQRLNASLDIPAGGGTISPMTLTLERAKEKAPHKGNIKALKIEDITVSNEALTVAFFAEDRADNFDIFAVTDTLVFTAEPVIKNNTIRIEKPVDIENLEEVLKGKTLSVTLKNGEDAIEVEQKF